LASTARTTGRWRVSVKDILDGSVATVSAKFVFIGAGGGALPLLQKSKIPEGKGYGGFPVSGIWLGCDVDAVSHRHHAKVYGKASDGSPPLTVPHLDTRIIGGKHSLLFGPYAGFSTHFLKHGALADLFTSLTFDNIPLLDVARDNSRWAEYLIGQVLQCSSQQFATLKQFVPHAVKKDWQEVVAGQRVVTIKPHESKGWFKHEEGELEFGTELVMAEDVDRGSAGRLAWRLHCRVHRNRHSREMLQGRADGEPLASQTKRNHPVLWRIADQGRRTHPTSARRHGGRAAPG
jgi:malate dehydrogenase (quinone)